MEATKFYPDIQVLEANTEEGHVPFLVSIPLKMGLSRACFGRLACMPMLSSIREEC